MARRYKTSMNASCSVMGFPLGLLESDLVERLSHEILVLGLAPAPQPQHGVGNKQRRVDPGARHVAGKLGHEGGATLVELLEQTHAVERVQVQRGVEEGVRVARRAQPCVVIGDEGQGVQTWSS